MTIQLLQVNQIWDSAPHNAFTDLIRFNNHWFCGFREASSHMSLDGQVRILQSADGQNWQSFAVISWAGGDVRDPKFVINPNGELIVLTGIRLAVCPEVPDSIVSVGWQLKIFGEVDGPYWDEFSSGTWRWAASSYLDTLYTVGYAQKDLQGCLYRSEDGLTWQPHVKPFFPEAPCFANEASLVFDEQKGYCLLRRDGKDCSGLLGIADFPFQDWHWQTLDIYLGGPKLIKTLKGLIAAFRVFVEDSAKTQLYIIQPDATLTFLFELPSFGDTSYPGLVEFDGDLWVSYYSTVTSSEGLSKAAIFIAQLQLN